MTSSSGGSLSSPPNPTWCTGSPRAAAESAKAPTRSLNLGLHVGDDPALVIENRQRVCAALGVDFARLTLSAQVHGAGMAEVGEASAGAGRAAAAGAIPEVDGLMVSTPGLPVAVLSADCVPLLFYDPRRHVAAAVHAGWRGTAAGMAANAVQFLAARGSDPSDLLVGLGPAIGPCCYRVSEEVARSIGVAEQRADGWYADLPAANRRQLLAAGVLAARIESADLCTSCHAEEFFSERKLGRPHREAGGVDSFAVRQGHPARRRKANYPEVGGAAMQAWISSSLVRHYPKSPPQSQETLTFHAALQERVSFQVAFTSDAEPVKMTAVVEAPPELAVRVRSVGYVPMPHFTVNTPVEELDGLAFVPGYVPDPLFPSPTLEAGPRETNAFWVTVLVPMDCLPGEYPIYLQARIRRPRALHASAKIVVHRGLVSRRHDFPVTHWFYADALCDWYKVEPFEEAFWPILDRYLADLSEHLQDTTHVPIFTPPTDGVKRPTQLLEVRREGDRYRFDWALVKRWIEAARQAGLSYFEWTHLFSQWGAKYAIRIYDGRGQGEKLLWDPETPGTSATYRDFLSQFLPEFKRFLEVEGIFARSFFHLSDEPHGEEHLAHYRAAREMLREVAPWMKVMDALSEISFAREGLTDTPIPLLPTAPDFIKEGYPAWAYFCCHPVGRYPQRLLDTPLVKTRMFGWLFYRLQARGFLHWGYNYWYRSQTRELIDPFFVSDGGRWPEWFYGDTFIVYPGPGAPIDSLRWEVFADGLQDYALLQSANLDPDDPLLEKIKDYAEFPRSEQWLLETRGKVLERLDRR